MNLSFQSKLSGRALYIASEWARLTCRLTINGLHHYQKTQDSNKSVLWATWHGNSHLILPFMQQYAKRLKVTIMIPDDWRGEVIYHWVKLIDKTPYPMDLETKGIATARKLTQLIRTLKSEVTNNYIAPDGPAGPSHEVKPGLGFLAKKTGLPILPVAGFNHVGFTVNRWDGYRMPLPFSRIQITFGEPFTIDRKEETAVTNERIRRALNDVSMQAKADFYAAAASNHAH